MSGFNRHIGCGIEGDAHLAQSIHDILTTPKGSLVMLRDYGSDVPDILDQPINEETNLDAYMAIAEALDVWEPRIEIVRVQMDQTGPGRAECILLDAENNEILMPLDLSPQGEVS